MASLADIDSITSWVKLTTEDGTPYYFHPVLNTTQWEEPSEYLDPDAELEQDGMDDEILVEDQVQLLEGEEDQGGEQYEQPAEDVETETSYYEVEEEPPAPQTSARAHGRKMRGKSHRRSGTKAKYTVKTTVSFGGGRGADAGEVYYVNEETGETLWDKPDDFEDYVVDETFVGNGDWEDDEDLEPWTELSEDLDECFQQLDLFSDTMETESKAMLAGDKDASRNVIRRLEYLKEMFQNVGSEEEWLVRVDDENFQLGFTLFSLWDNRTPRHVRLLVCRLLVMLSKCNPQVLVLIGAEEWGELHAVWDVVSVGIKEASKFEELADEAYLCWLFFLHGLFTECQAYGINEIGLPNEKFFGTVMNLLADTSEDVFVNTTKTLVAMAGHFEVEKSAFLQALLTHKDAQHFGEGAIHILNEQHYPYNDEALLLQTLEVFRHIFSLATTSKYFYTNDMRVIVDICIRELGNLPPQDDVIASYLSVLSALLQNSQWLEQNRYRREEVCEVLERILDAGGDEDGNGYSIVAMDTVRVVLEECGALLED